MLSESFHMTTKEHRIANSPTIFFDVKQEVNNRTNIEDRIEVLYCGCVHHTALINPGFAVIEHRCT